MNQISKRFFNAGEVIFAEGDVQDIAYIVEEGMVEIWTMIDDERRVLNSLGMGSLFGELALVDRQPRSASATAATDTLLTIVTQQQVDERLTDADPILRMVLFVVMQHFRSEVERSRAAYGPFARKTSVAADTDLNERKIAEAIEMIKVEAELKAAMRDNEFRLLYQPIYDLESQKIEGVEALIRWRSPTRGEILPASFMPLAESTSLILPIGNWVIECGLKDLTRFRDGVRKDLTLSFNLARRQMESQAFLPFLSDSVKSHGIPPENIKLEMLERNLFQSDHVKYWMRECAARGFSILLDDFGTGYSSLQYLQEYQPAALKIDRSFVKGLGLRPESDRICKAIIDLAEALGIGAIAEGVETAEQARRLKEMRCRYAQGFLFSPPVSAAEIVHKLGA